MSTAPTALRALPNLRGRRIDLTWVNPPASELSQSEVRIVRRERAFPTTPTDGPTVYSGPVVDRFTDTGLTPLTRYYYTVFAYDGTSYHGSQVSALATDEYGLAERLYRMLPAVHQREDAGGQLRRFLAAAGAPLGLMRSTAEGLRQLREVDRVPPEYLRAFAELLDWRLDRTLPLARQRNEIRAAPRLYRVVGTAPAVRTVAGRTTRIVEYVQHIARTNEPPRGNVFALRDGQSTVVTLEGAPRGRLAVARTGASTFRLFYAVGNTVRHKAYRGEWSDSAEVFQNAGEPAVATLSDGRLLLAWVESPGTSVSALRSAVGTPAAPRPAVLTEERRSPLPVQPGAFLVLRGDRTVRGMRFSRNDFADVTRPLVTEVAAAVNRQMSGYATASVAPGDRLRLQSVATGGNAVLTVDLALSGAAAALGFTSANNFATGDWGDAITWGTVTSIGSPGWLTDLAAVADGGDAFLAYAQHDGSSWQIRTRQWTGGVWGTDIALTTEAGVSSRAPTLARDDTRQIWAVWSRQGSLRSRSRTFSTGTWGAEAQLTAGTGEGDHEPALIITGGQRRVYYRSERDLAQLVMGGATTVLRTGAPLDSWPAPVDVNGGVTVLHRSDQSVTYDPDTGTARRCAGTTTVALSDVARLARGGTADDLMSYTPNRPEGGPTRDDEPYTRGAVGLFVPGADVERLRAAVSRFLPVNTRAIIRTGS